MIIYNI